MIYTAYFDSLGCDKNLVDSEKMMAILKGHRIIFVADPAEADIIIVNTCAFILDAKKESIETILELARYRTKSRCKALIVTGCLAERYHDEIRDEIPEVDAIVGTSGYANIMDAIEEVLSGERPDILTSIDTSPKGLISRVSTGTTHVRYLKIAEGCDKHCTYCIIPSLRGHYRSVPMEDIIKEAVFLANNGAKELILVAQETTVYGIDIYGEKSLPKLLQKLCKIDGIEWIRLLYCYPEEITKELIDIMKAEDKICNYLDLPIQHSEDGVLKSMGRRTTKEELRKKIDMIREKIPDIALRTTLISGFPGETKSEHEACIDFIRDVGFDRLGVFPYSMEEGTIAAKRDDQVDDDIKREWADELMEASTEIIYDKNESLIGESFDVMVDGYLSDDDRYVGRTYRDAPDIDGYVFFAFPGELISGDIVRVRIKEAYEYDLIGEAVLR